MNIFSEILLNKWFLSFAVGWAVFFVLIDWKKLNVNVWVGIIACILQLIHDTESSYHNLYQFYDVGIGLLRTSAFFTFGVVFTIGIIFIQYMPRNTTLKIVHVIVFAVGFLIYEYITVSNGMLKHFQYTYWISLLDNLIILSTLAWTKNFVLFIYNTLGRKPEKC
jgi:hypothetical protein